MEGGRRKGQQEEELFLRRPSAEPETPTVGPLRIQKRDSASPPPQGGKSTNNRFDNFPQPPKSQPYQIPAKATSSTPLPYPSDPLPAKPSQFRPPYPLDTDQDSQPNRERDRRGSSGAHSNTSQRTKFEANDPNRPTLAGYARDQHPSHSRTEHRSGTPNSVHSSQTPDTPGSEDLFQKLPRTLASDGKNENQKHNPQSEVNPYPDYHQQYWPPSGTSSAAQKVNNPGLKIPSPQGVNRISSTASTSTTKAQRGSPPPPETPATDLPVPGGIEARYAAAGIAGTSTLTNLQAQSAAAYQRANEYGGQPSRAGINQQSQTAQRPWTPTEQPDSQVHGPPTVYQGTSQIHSSSGMVSQQPGPTSRPAQNSSAPSSSMNNLENDIQRLNVSEEPPPSYTSVTQTGHGGPTAQNYPSEKVPVQASIASIPAAQHTVPSEPNHLIHPAFANEARHNANGTPVSQNNVVPIQQSQRVNSPAPAAGPGPSPASPPPLPEGWIAHLDPSSGQYYYIHLQTQSTQWEFPKGPTPLNLNEPLSPTGTFVNPLASPGVSSMHSKPLASPVFTPQPGGYPHDSIANAGITSPTTTGFTGPPPSSGVDMYKIAPTNGVYFGPYLRYTNMDVERGLWLGSILLITDAPQPPVIHIHQSIDLSPNRKHS